jgi:hypothetical protein
MTQPELDFSARARRDDGLRRVEDNAGAWIDEAFAFVAAYLRAHETLFCDDLWSAGLRRPSNPKALGAVMVRAARAGLMVREGYRPSVASNLAPKPVWRSLVCGGTR